MLPRIQFGKMMQKEDVSIPIIEKGEFNVGVYTSPTNTKALTVVEIPDIISKSFVSSKHWSIDWLTLESLKIKRLIHTIKWSSMVKMVATKRADYLLAPFPNSKSLEISFENYTLLNKLNYGLSHLVIFH